MSGLLYADTVLVRVMKDGGADQCGLFARRFGGYVQAGETGLRHDGAMVR